MISTTDVDVNLESASDLIAQAANQGAEFLLLPENFPLMGHEEQDKVAKQIRKADINKETALMKKELNNTNNEIGVFCSSW